jgi:hypothetical protein
MQLDINNRNNAGGIVTKDPIAICQTFLKIGTPALMRSDFLR